MNIFPSVRYIRYDLNSLMVSKVAKFLTNGFGIFSREYYAVLKRLVSAYNKNT